MTTPSPRVGRLSGPNASARPAPMRRFPSPGEDAERVSVRYAVQDYALDAGAHRLQLASGFVPHGASHYRIDVDETYARGGYEFCGILDGFLMMAVDAEYPAPRSAYLHSPDSLHIYLACAGDGEYVALDGPPISFEAPSTVLIMEPAGRPPAEITFAGRTRYIYIILHRDVLRTLYAESADELPAILQAFLLGDLAETSGRTLPLSAAMLRCLDDVHSCSLEGQIRRLFLQSKALEIVCHALDAFDQSGCFGPVESPKHTARSILKAQLFLAENFVAPPPLEKLAASVGLSRSALCSGFRQLLDQSVYEYVRDLRMQQALRLLSDSDEPIIQIAYAVGYSRPSSFSVAVHRHFGATPSELRRKAGRPPTPGV